jgi:hypothetical protein
MKAAIAASVALLQQQDEDIPRHCPIIATMKNVKTLILTATGLVFNGISKIFL